MLTKQQCEAIRGYCEKAADWKCVEDSPCDECWAEEYPDDATFVVRARQDMPKLLRTASMLRGLLLSAIQGAAPEGSELRRRIDEALE